VLLCQSNITVVILSRVNSTLKQGFSIGSLEQTPNFNPSAYNQLTSTSFSLQHTQVALQDEGMETKTKSRSCWVFLASKDNLLALQNNATITQN